MTGERPAPIAGLTDVRDRTLVLLACLGVPAPDHKRMRAIERFVRWVDAQICAAHLDGQRMTTGRDAT